MFRQKRLLQLARNTKQVKTGGPGVLAWIQACKRGAESQKQLFVPYDAACTTAGPLLAGKPLADLCMAACKFAAASVHNTVDRALATDAHMLAGKRSYKTGTRLDWLICGTAPFDIRVPRL